MSDFDDVGAFHKKFGLRVAGGAPPGEIDPKLRDFRLRFLLEELSELCEGYGMRLTYSLERLDEKQDLAKIADALVDLAYVDLGTAHVHGFPWPALFAEVQRANVTKERCGIDHRFTDSGHPVDLDSCDHEGCGQPRVKHSMRGSANDVIKPEGWRAPDIIGALTKAGWPGPRLPL